MRHALLAHAVFAASAMGMWLMIGQVSATWAQTSTLVSQAWATTLLNLATPLAR